MKLNILVALLSLSLTNQAMALAVVKLNGTAARGECLPSPIDASSDIFKQNRISVNGGKAQQIRALKKVIHAISNIGDGSFKYHQGARYRFIVDGRRASNYDGYQLNIRPGNQNRRGLSAGLGKMVEGTGQDNHALLTHELGHYIGHQKPVGPLAEKGSTIYQAYRKSVKKCSVSGYAHKDKAHKRHEEFAEAFTAYVTNPQMLLKTEGCTEVFAFFSTLFGENTAPESCNARMASIQNKAKLEVQTVATEEDLGDSI